MKHLVKKVRVASNPRASSSRPPARKKGKTMAKHSTKKKKAMNNGGHRKNAAAHRPRRKKRNPSGVMGLVGHPKNLLVGGISGLASAVATRQLPQMILGAGNTGVEGYIANAVTTLVATYLAGSFAGPVAGFGALIGGTVIVLDRIASENISPISSYLSLSGVGDANAYSKLGTIRSGYYTHPNLQNPDGSMWVPDPITDAAVAAVVAKYPSVAQPLAAAMGVPAGGKMGAVNPSAMRRHTASGQLLSSRFQGRFNQ